MTRGSLLIGDLGGTHARFALADPTGSGFSGQFTLECSAYPSVEGAIEAYLRTVEAPPPEAICLAVAAPMGSDEVRFLNNKWKLRSDSLAQRFNGSRITLVNDFEAVAYAIPLLSDQDVAAIGRGRQPAKWQKDFTIGVLGPGTGLGVSALLGSGGHLRALSSEGGHLGFAPENDWQAEILKCLRRKFDRVSDERLLSGPGIENIYAALCELHGRQIRQRCAAEIGKAAVHGEDDIAGETIDLFVEILGQVAGNLALTLGAREGIYIAGGIAGRYAEQLQSGRFRAGFENKGRHRALMEQIPTFLITHPHPGLLGASHLVRADGAA